MGNQLKMLSGSKGQFLRDAKCLKLNHKLQALQVSTRLQSLHNLKHRLISAGLSRKSAVNSKCCLAANYNYYEMLNLNHKLQDGHRK